MPDELNRRTTDQ